MLGEELTREGRRASGERLLGSRNFAGYNARGIFMGLDGKERLTVGAIEDVDETLFCGLRNGVDLFAATLYGEENRLSRKVAGPKIVVDALKMPDSFAGLRIQGEQAICEEIVADAIGAVEIKSGGARGSVEDSALGIERHPGPIVGGAAGFPGVLGPSVIAELAGVGNGVKRPAQLAGTNIVGANVAGRCGKSLGVAAT